MIADRERTTLISSMGWVEHGDLWVFDVAQELARRVSIGSAAKYLSLHVGSAGYFSVAHHHEGPRFEVTVHRFTEPSGAIARATVTDEVREVSGDSATWRNVPLLYTPYLALPGLTDFVLVTIDPEHATVEVEKLDWYDDTYDKGYQGVVGVSRIPDKDVAVFSVQRSSDLVLYDLKERKRRGVVPLAGRHGNPSLLFREAERELWATDYDTLLVICVDTWRVLRSRRLQEAASGTGQFIGDGAFDSGEELYAVARPFSGDVVAMDPASLKVRWSANVGRQPLELAVLPGRRVVARDWKTGDTLRGELRRRWIPR